MSSSARSLHAVWDTSPEDHDAASEVPPGWFRACSGNRKWQCKCTRISRDARKWRAGTADGLDVSQCRFSVYLRASLLICVHLRFPLLRRVRQRAGLAFACHTVCDHAEELWRLASSKASSRARFFNRLVAITRFLVFPSWDNLMRTLAFLQPPVNRPDQRQHPSNTPSTPQPQIRR
jgi:hypothetical protein